MRDPEATRQIGRQLQTADRLSAISRITGGVAHEVKNPLNAILMHVELARMKLAKGDNDLKPQMDIITSEIVRLDRVVKIEGKRLRGKDKTVAKRHAITSRALGDCRQWLGLPARAEAAE